MDAEQFRRRLSAFERDLFRGGARRAPALHAGPCASPDPNVGLSALFGMTLALLSLLSAQRRRLRASDSALVVLALAVGMVAGLTTLVQGSLAHFLQRLLLKADANGVPALGFAEAGAPRIGQVGVALAAPRGTGCRAEMTMVAADFLLEEPALKASMTLAPPLENGSPGMPVADVAGRVIGVAGIDSGERSGAFSSLLPASTAAAAAAALLRRGGGDLRFGFRAEEIWPAVAGRLGAERGRGAMVVLVRPGSWVDREGLRAGDLVFGVGGRPVSGVSELARLLDRADGAVTKTCSAAPGRSPSTCKKRGRGTSRRHRRAEPLAASIPSRPEADVTALAKSATAGGATILPCPNAADQIDCSRRACSSTGDQRALRVGWTGSSEARPGRDVAARRLDAVVLLQVVVDARRDHLMPGGDDGKPPAGRGRAARVMFAGHSPAW